MDLTVELASCYMLLWDEKLKKICKKLGINLDLFKRYVDDSIQITGGLTTGWEYCNTSKQLIHKENGMYDNLPMDQRTFAISRDIAYGIDPCIVMEYDVPSLHENGRLPVLDLELWIDDTNKCLYSFYTKKISTPYTILYNSAVPVETKRTKSSTRRHEKTI